MNKLKLVSIIFGVVILVSCGKEISLAYNIGQDDNASIAVETPEQKNKEFTLVGIWDGTEICKNCCIKKTRFTLTITKHEKEKVEGTLKIAQLSDQRYYMDFELKMNYQEDKGILTIKRTKLLKEVGIVDDLHCAICNDNVMELKLSEDKKGFEGKWIETKEGVQNCQTALKGGSIIKIIKTK